MVRAPARDEGLRAALPGVAVVGNEKVQVGSPYTLPGPGERVIQQADVLVFDGFDVQMPRGLARLDRP
ncbi:hypothetical protein GCM10009628_36090 [Paeniglutamicibacter kerguelensis]